MAQNGTAFPDVTGAAEDVTAGLTSPMTAFHWTRRSEQAALLVAADELPDTQIADQLAVGRTTLERWKRHPAFRERVGNHVATWRAELRQRGIAEKQNRLDAYNDRWQALQTVIAERGADPAMQRVPGGKTGLLVRQVKLVKVYITTGDPPEDGGEDEEDGAGERLESAKLYVEQEEFAVDTGTLKALLDIEKQAAIETGQWEEKQVHSGGVKITVEYADAPAAAPAPPRVRLIEG
jgi:hypothetical protein